MPFQTAPPAHGIVIHVNMSYNATSEDSDKTANVWGLVRASANRIQREASQSIWFSPTGSVTTFNVHVCTHFTLNQLVMCRTLGERRF